MVSGGPFAGLRYTRRTAVGRIVAKLVGSYEEELHDALVDMIESKPRTVVDIGSAEGYYAVGIARRLPEARVHAFETEASRRDGCKDLALENGVADRVVLHGTCSTEDLERLSEPGDFVICDCEGFETEVLQVDKVPWLKTARLLVEIHDAFVPGTTEMLSARFAPTHDLQFIPEAPREAARYPALDGLRAWEKDEALDEYRRDRQGRSLRMQWAMMTPRA